MTAEPAPAVTLAVPCRTDEPALGRTLATAHASWRRVPGSAAGPFEVLVCLNGEGGEAPRRALQRFADELDAPLAELDADGSPPPVLPPRSGRLGVALLSTRRAGKPIAWNVLRRHARTPLAVFVDADVSFTPDALPLLLAALDAHPDAILASAKTTCAPRPTRFERVMAAPYAIDFPNLSAQLYAARVGALPATMPEDLIEPERWLELVVGRAAVVREPAACVAVRLPGTLADFFRQRVRIEMGKVQLARAYPGLAARGESQPRFGAALRSLDAPGLARLATYLVLRSVAHAVAWRRYRRGEVHGIWLQASSTKEWDPA